MMKIFSSITLILIMVSGCSTVPRSFSPTHPIPPNEFSYQVFQQVLETHVSDGVVDYASIAEDPRYRDFLQQLEQLAPTQLHTPNHRLAFWINAYNAFAIKGIVDGLSPNSLTGRYTYFVSQQYSVGGKTINLYDLERKLLIPDYREPRIHFAIVCASQSCPKLRSWARSEEHTSELQSH